MPSCIRKNAFFLFSAILVSFFSSTSYANQQFSVERTLKWDDAARTFSTDEKSTQYKGFYFSGANYSSSDTKFLPSYGESFAISTVGKATIQIERAIYEPLNGAEILEGKNIMGAIFPTYLFTYVKTKPYIDISFVPIRRNERTGQYEKLVSFTLVVTIVEDNTTSDIHSRESDANFTAHSVLENGTWYKIAVDKEGIFKIDKSFLDALGINTTSFNLNTFGIFGNGGGMLPEKNIAFRYDDLQENAFYSVGLADGSFDNGDYILFYAQAPDQWYFSYSSNKYYHKKNIYSDKTYYFITPDAGTGKSIQNQNSSAAAENYTTSTYDGLQVLDNDKTNLVETGREWFGDSFDPYNTLKSYSFSFPDITTDAIKMKAVLAGKTSSGSITYSVNSHSLLLTSVPEGLESPFADVDSIITTISPAAALTVNVSFNGPVNSLGWIDYIELVARQNLKYANNQLQFRDYNTIGVGKITKFTLSASSETMVWDVTKSIAVKNQLTTTVGASIEFTLATDSLKKFIAFHVDDAFPSSDIDNEGKIANQNYHSASVSPKLIIISYPDYLDQARTLAAYHKTVDGLDTVVVDIKKLYNEFSSGAQDITAIRDFVRMYYERAEGIDELMPKYVILFGDGSFDYKNIMYSADDNTNKIPTYESYESINGVTNYTSDDYYVCLDPTEGADMSSSVNKLDAAVGRFPVNSTEEATDVVNKIMHYKSTETLGSWRNSLCFVADDQDGNTHESDADSLAQYVSHNYPLYNINKIYLDAYQQVPGAGGARYPDVNTAINDQIFAGTLLMNYSGHGNEQNWTQERVIGIDAINSWTNYDKLPLFVTATCTFSRYDSPAKTSAGELIFLSNKGGGIGLVTTVRIVYSSSNLNLNSNFFFKIFEPQPDGTMPTLGEAMVNCKNAVSDAVNNRKFTLLGDPALRLNYPRYNVVTTTVNGVSLADADTLKALSKVTIQGQVTDQAGVKLTSFNGTVYPTVYDKFINIHTLMNDPDSYPFTFRLQKNAIYKGKASVINGDFSFTFIVPKDISYDFGNGKLSYYADNGVDDAAGNELSIVVGGTSDGAAADATGPGVDVYMNDIQFAFGGLTDQNPLLYIKLNDFSGINTVGNGIGHDITATLDDDQQTAFKLNDYYEAALDSYQDGSVSYPLRDIASGRHAVSVKAWDVYNNSGEGYTEFVVAENAKLALDHVLNYPNPFTTHTEFMFEHNRPGDVLDIKIEIYTVSGRLIKTIQQQTLSDGYRISGITWDGLDDFGDNIGRGVYVYKLTVKAESDNAKANEFQKLVILR